uniref:Uncharacterized protein n=1 Tax=Rhizophora mucronata TaxID=61149 RepID=A0A2P2PIS6_RHIMU
MDIKMKRECCHDYGNSSKEVEEGNPVVQMR